MLLGYHKSWTENALHHTSINANMKREVSIGCTANDLCELTNENFLYILVKDIAATEVDLSSSAAYDSKDDVYQTFGLMPFLFGNLAIFQSHFGSLASLHGMAKAAQEAPETTRQEIISWFDFLNSVALGTVAIKPRERIYNSNTALRRFFFHCRKIEYHQLFDSEDQFEIKHRAVGMMCHLIEDLFTLSHCERTADNEIRKFYYYDLQDKDKHRHGDHAVAGLEQELSAQCRLCIENTAKNIPYDYKPLLVLSQDAQKSDGGAFA